MKNCIFLADIYLASILCGQLLKNDYEYILISPFHKRFSYALYFENTTLLALLIWHCI